MTGLDMSDREWSEWQEKQISLQGVIEKHFQSTDKLVEIDEAIAVRINGRYGDYPVVKKFIEDGVESRVAFAIGMIATEEVLIEGGYIEKSGL